VSIRLQDCLGLAKVRYQNRRLRSLDSQNQAHQDRQQNVPESDRPTDSSPEIAYDNYETPLTSPALQNLSSKELPRSARSKHAATFDLDTMQPMLSAGRKRVRSDSITDDLPVKVPRLSWKSSHHLPESSPAISRFRPMFYRPQSPFATETGPELPSPALHTNSDDDNDPDLPSHSLQNVTSSLISSSPPRTPPPKYARLRNEKTLDCDDGADLLLFLANSPTPARGTRPQARELPPSTPPSQYAALPSLTPTPGGGVFANFGTPNQQFNFADFVNVTPSPAQRPWGGRTPGGLCKTPLAAKEARRKLNFDAMIPPTDSPKSRVKNSGLALQLGDELRR
ncbi:hypothetical protein Egran_00203, partial [Elaphomyces granulatus]